MRHIHNNRSNHSVAVGAVNYWHRRRNIMVAIFTAIVSGNERTDKGDMFAACGNGRSWGGKRYSCAVDRIVRSSPQYDQEWFCPCSPILFYPCFNPPQCIGAKRFLPVKNAFARNRPVDDFCGTPPRQIIKQSRFFGMGLFCPDNFFSG